MLKRKTEGGNAGWVSSPLTGYSWSQAAIAFPVFCFFLKTLRVCFCFTFIHTLVFKQLLARHFLSSRSLPFWFFVFVVIITEIYCALFFKTNEISGKIFLIITRSHETLKREISAPSFFFSLSSSKFLLDQSSSRLKTPRPVSVSNTESWKMKMHPFSSLISRVSVVKLRNHHNKVCLHLNV